MLVITHKRYDCTNHDDKSKQVRICNHSLSPFRKVSERMARNRLTAPLLIVLYCQGAQICAASDFREIHDLIYGIPELPKFNLGRQLKLICCRVNRSKGQFVRLPPDPILDWATWGVFPSLKRRTVLFGLC